MRAESLKGHLDALVLATLGDEPLHGYAVIEALRARSEGAFDLAEGTVYPVLHRLEADGSADEQLVDGRRDAGGGSIGSRGAAVRRSGGSAPSGGRSCAPSTSVLA